MREPTYTTSWSATAPVGTFAALTNPAASGRIYRIASAFITNAASTQIRLYRSQATQPSGGTSVSLIANPRDTAFPASAAIARYYTAAPAPGSREHLLLLASYTGAAANQWNAAPRPSIAEITLRPGETLEIDTTVGTTYQVSISWTESPQ